MPKWPPVFELDAAPSNPLGPGGKALIRYLRALIEGFDDLLERLESRLDAPAARVTTRRGSKVTARGGSRVTARSVSKARRGAR